MATGLWPFYAAATMYKKYIRQHTWGIVMTKLSNQRAIGSCNKHSVHNTTGVHGGSV